jgi:hypothetical protein
MGVAAIFFFKKQLSLVTRTRAQRPVYRFCFSRKHKGIGQKR